MLGLAGGLSMTPALHAQGSGPDAAYLDTAAAMLLEGARASRARLDSTLAAYETTVSERVSVGFRLFWRERLLYRREVAMRLSWRRGGPSRVEVLGGRSVVPVASTAIQAPGPRELAGSAGGLLFHPGGDRLLLGLDDGDALRHPLAADAEADYRYESGDTMRLALPDGRSIQLVELRVHPRRDDYDLVAGSFWLDGETHDVVRAIYRPARPFELERDWGRLDEDEAGADEDDSRAVRWLPGFLRPMRAEVRQIAVEYGLWDLRWWLPRLVRVEMRGSAGEALGMPVQYERRYSAYEVEPLPPPSPDSPVPPVAGIEPCEEETEDGERRRRTFVAPDSAAAPGSIGRLADGERWGCRCPADRPCELYIVAAVPPPDSLVASAALPRSIFAEAGDLATRAERDAIERITESLTRTEDRWARPDLSLTWGLGGSGLLRYNRVEGLSIGARMDADAGRASAALTARLGTADREPNGEIGLQSDYYLPGVRLAAYRRLAAANHARGALGLGNSVFAATFGTDDGDYFRALGFEVGRASGTPRSGWDWRVFAERQSPAAKHTDRSLRRAIDDGHRFRPNFTASDADQLGIELTLGYGRGLAADGVRWGVRTSALATVGTFDFTRGSLAGWLTFPLPAGLVGAVEAEAGGTAGEAPPQALWRIGGPASLRGYGGSATVGESFWRGRAELASAVPGIRIAVFADAAWAGPRGDWPGDRPLRAVGVGAGVLDGIIRFDIGRALDPPRGWRLALYLDGLL